jgi:transmembrane 9 superfamily protein 2/4
MWRAGALLASSLAAASALYLPGTQPVDYKSGEQIPMYVNKIWSSRTQLPYNYYSLPFCRPAELVTQRENIGQIIVGDRIQNSDYKLVLGENTACEFLCAKKYEAEDTAAFTEKIEQEYTVNWILDGLPAAVRMYDEANPADVHYERGFPLGYAAPDGETGEMRYLLFNHIQFFILYHQEDGKAEVDPEDAPTATKEGIKYRIVGFEVEPYSVAHTKEDPKEPFARGNVATCKADRPPQRTDPGQEIDKPGVEVAFTYDVQWVASPTRWADRWNKYLVSGNDDDIHWFSIINSLMIVLFLTGMIAMILMRNLYRDIARYNAEASPEEAQEETGWKLVHGDVFRPPAGFFGPMFLSVFVGSGMQILAMSFFLLGFAVLGFLSPANQGSLLTGFILLFVFMGSFAGYFSSRLYKMFKGKAFKRNTTLTAFAFPGTLFGIAFVINLFIWQKRSSMAMPFSTMLSLFVLWFCVSTPLVFLGAYLGFKKDEIKHPVRVNNIPRQIPAQPWYLHPIPSILVGGILPFGAVFIELFFIMSSLWLAQVYYVFGFLFLVLMILLVTCAEISIVMAYFQLCSEDYNWWWRSFLTSGSSAVYLYLYAIVYFSTKLEITGFTSSLLYFGYMAMFAWVFFLLTGSIGFVACLTFVNKIYSAIKVD